MVQRAKTSTRLQYEAECVIHIGDSCFAYFAEVMLPYTFTYENYSFENVQ
jgi:hypothetical protein